MTNTPINRLGAVIDAHGQTHFRVWAPRVPQMRLHLAGTNARLLTMEVEADGYHFAVVKNAPTGTRYGYQLGNDLLRPDPASRSQPDGVHGLSQVVETEYNWTDQEWRNRDLSQHAIYELHVGTFTREGTFDAAIGRLDDLVALGVTAIELMPIAEFPGSRNWGYDGTCLFAAHHAYGGLFGLKRLVKACHGCGLAVFLDVVYNHLGPEGNYIGEFAPYITDQYKTPWGPAMNFDDAGSDDVRRFFIENALQWIDECHIDGLRLDAVHAIRDHTARTFLEELTQVVHDVADRQGRVIHVIAESADNDPRLVRPVAHGGVGMDASWNDDFHHALHVLLTGEGEGYYADFKSIADLAKAWTHGYVYAGQRSASRQRRHGRSAHGLHGSSFVVSCQNHDQIGNRMLGDRLQHQAGLDGCRMAAACMLLSPFVPLLFMGEEYAEDAPFQYFVSHGDADLVEAVRQGRSEEFAGFKWSGKVPDPQDPTTFENSRLDWALRNQKSHAKMLAFYQRLLKMRRSSPVFGCGDLDNVSVVLHPSAQAMTVHRRISDEEAMIIVNFEREIVECAINASSVVWQCELDSTDLAWGGDGLSGAPRIEAKCELIQAPARSVVVYRQRS